MPHNSGRRIAVAALLVVLSAGAALAVWQGFRPTPHAAGPAHPVLPSRIMVTVGRTCSPGFAGRNALWPQAVINDGNGGLYVADWSQSAVCHISAAGVIEAVAGDGAAGYLGDGGPATNTELYLPTGLALDAGRHLLYIADRWNQRVRVVDLRTGTIRTAVGDGVQGFAGDGGPAAAARLDYPTGVAVDAAGDLFIADSGNFRVRMVNRAQVITTVAGTSSGGSTADGVPATTARLVNPTAVAVTSTGRLLVTDTGSNRVRAVDPVTGSIVTVAGSGLPGLSGDGGPAAAALLSFPTGLALDGVGDIFVADTGNGRIREVHAGTGAITSVRTPSLKGPFGLCLQAGNSIVVADSGHYALRRFGLGPGAPAAEVLAGDGFPSLVPGTEPARLAELDHPNAVVAGPGGTLIFAEGGTPVVRRISADGIVSTVAGDGRAGSAGDGGPATAARLTFPVGLAVDALGDVWIADAGGGRVRRVDAASRRITTALGPTGPDGLNDPTGLALDQRGDLFVSDTGHDRILELTPDGTARLVAGTGVGGFSGDGGPAAAARLDHPTGLAFSGDTLYVADRSNQRIRAVSISTGLIRTVLGDGRVGFTEPGTPPLSSPLDQPAGVAVDAAGDLFVADTGNCLLRMVSRPGTAAAQLINLVGVLPSGPVSPRCGHQPTATVPSETLLYNPLSVTVDQAGNAYIADSLSNTIIELTAGVPN